MRQIYYDCAVVFFSAFALAWTTASTPLLAQNIQVTSATPPAAAQGTTNLNVVVGGNGFAKGAKAAFYLSGTTNPAGVTVNSTAFNSKSQVTANITISDTATISSFDVVVQNTDGRSGKGTKLFQVTVKGTPTGCTTLGTPSTFTLVTTLNSINASGNPTYPAGFGGEIRVRPVTVNNGTNSRTVLVAAVSTNGVGTMDFFILDPATGQVLDGQSLLAGSPPQPHISVAYTGSGFVSFSAGDVNGDGIPDFVGGLGGADVFVGHMDSQGILSYELFQLTPPSGSPAHFGSGVAMGNLDGGLGDDVVVGASGGGSGGSALAGAVFIYAFTGSGFGLIDTLDDPLPNAKNNDNFGYSVAVGEVTSPLAPNLIVGANNANVNGNAAAGRVFVFPAPISSPTTYYTLATGIKGDGLGRDVGSGNVNGSVDVFGTTGWGIPDTKVAIFTGPIAGSKTSPNLVFASDPRLSSDGWSTNLEYGDMLGDGHTELFVGVPNASNSACSVSVGAAELFFPSTSNLNQPTFTFQPLTIPDKFNAYGWGVGLVPGSAGNPPLVLVGETGPGQVYVYKKN
ncbi:MAG TPA: VCBS repeat-containing protein [Terriglobia bacterium]|nr:VCBS repeat-containing protein [Terriglobia bacterium]